MQAATAATASAATSKPFELCVRTGQGTTNGATVKIELYNKHGVILQTFSRSITQSTKFEVKHTPDAARINAEIGGKGDAWQLPQEQDEIVSLEIKTWPTHHSVYSHAFAVHTAETIQLEQTIDTNQLEQIAKTNQLAPNADRVLP